MRSITGLGPVQAAALVLGICLSGAAFAADDYPSKPISLTTATGPGGAIDVTARFIAKKVSEMWGVPITVTNHPGAGQSIGTADLVRAEPDGYRVGVVSATPILIRPNITEVEYDVLTDFTFIAQYGVFFHPVSVQAGSQFQTWQEVVDFARENPLLFRWSSGTLYGATHLATEAAFRKEGVQTTYVPFTGGAAAMTALIGGHIDATVVAEYAEPLRSGVTRILAESGPEEIPGHEDLPTYAELGYSLSPQIFYGIAGPAGLPDSVVEKWEAAVEEVVASEEFSKLMTRLSGNPAFLDSDTFTSRTMENVGKVREIVSELRGG